jgi:hypothetical protein
MGDTVMHLGAEDNITQSDLFGAARLACFGVSTGVDCREECTQRDVSGVGVGQMMLGSGSSGEQ